MSLCIKDEINNGWYRKLTIDVKFGTRPNFRYTQMVMAAFEFAPDILWFFLVLVKNSGGRSRGIQREPPTMGKQLGNFITCESSAPFCNLQSRARTHAVFRNMKLFQHWIKWKGLICWFLHLFIDKEISRSLIYFP
jgi:hypothetical protein